MYALKTVKPEQIQGIEVRNQEKIVELTGSRLDPQKAFEVIKSETRNFSEPNEKARQADALFIQLLELNGISVKGTASKMGASEQERIRIREQERKRALALLELELQLVA